MYELRWFKVVRLEVTQGQLQHNYWIECIQLELPIRI